MPRPDGWQRRRRPRPRRGSPPSRPICSLPGETFPIAITILTDGSAGELLPLDDLGITAPAGSRLTWRVAVLTDWFSLDDVAPGRISYVYDQPLAAGASYWTATSAEVSSTLD